MANDRVLLLFVPRVVGTASAFSADKDGGRAVRGFDVIAPGDAIFDRYEIVALIARGGMADVFLARDRRLNREVAIKAFRLGAADAARFDAETRLLARLTHRNLVCVFDAGERLGVPFVVLQFVPGPTLATVLASGPLPGREAARFGVDVAAGLEYIHERRIVHRDVKPSNILLDSDGRALLGDFGVAVLLDATRLTVEAMTIGTAAYLAPEQATGETVTGAADVYALGLVLLESLTGNPAFTGNFQEVIAAKLGRDPRIPVGLEDPWPDLLAAMTSRDPDLRPSAATVQDVLANEVTAATVVARRTAVEPSPTQIAPAASSVGAGWRRPSGWKLAVVAVGVVGLIGIVAAVAGGPDGDRAPSPSVSTTSTVATTATTPTTTREALCADLERRREVIEEQKDQADDGDDGDKDALDQVKEQLEQQKKDIDEQRKAAGC